MTILLVLQASKVNLFAEEPEKGVSKAKEASRNSVLVEGKMESDMDNWFTIHQTIYFAFFLKNGWANSIDPCALDSTQYEVLGL